MNTEVSISLHSLICHHVWKRSHAASLSKAYLQKSSLCTISPSQARLWRPILMAEESDGFLVPRFGPQNSIFYQQPWSTRPTTRSTKLATGSARLATRSNRPATRSNRQAAQSSRPSTRFSKPATRNQERQAGNHEHHTREAKLRDPHCRSAFRVQE